MIKMQDRVRHIQVLLDDPGIGLNKREKQALMREKKVYERLLVARLGSGFVHVAMLELQGLAKWKDLDLAHSVACQIVADVLRYLGYNRVADAFEEV